MVDRIITCVFLVGAFTCLPQMARATTEASTVEPQLESILSYSPQTETAQAAKEAPDQRESSKATEDCRGCHEDNLSLYNRTYHAAQEESCFSCHKGAAAEEHLKGQQEGNDVPGPSIEALDSKEANAVCLTCHESSHHPTWAGGMHDRREREVHRLPRGAFLQIGEESAEAGVRLGGLLRLPSGDSRDVASHFASPGARRPHGLRELPQPSRRKPPEDDQGGLGQRALPAVPHGEAGPVPLGARAGEGELPQLPQPSRVESRQASRGEAALSLPAVPSQHPSPWNPV